MEGDNVSPGLDKGIRIPERIADHQVHIKEQVGTAPYGGHKPGAKADVGDEMAVHDVQMEIVCTGIFHATDLIPQIGKVGRQEGGSHIKHELISFRFCFSC